MESSFVQRIERIEYYYTVIPNKVGAGAKVFNVLKAKSINLLAFNGFPLSAQRSQLDLVPSSGDALVAAAQKAGIKLVGPKVAFLITEWEHLGAVADILGKLEQAGVNVTAMQAIDTGDWHYGAGLPPKKESSFDVRLELKIKGVIYGQEIAFSRVNHQQTARS